MSNRTIGIRHPPFVSLKIFDLWFDPLSWKWKGRHSFRMQYLVFQSLSFVYVMEHHRGELCDALLLGGVILLHFVVGDTSLALLGFHALLGGDYRGWHSLRAILQVFPPSLGCRLLKQAMCCKPGWLSVGAQPPNFCLPIPRAHVSGNISNVVWYFRRF